MLAWSEALGRLIYPFSGIYYPADLRLRAGQGQQGTTPPGSASHKGLDPSQIGQTLQQCHSFGVLGLAAVAHFGIAEWLLRVQEGVLHLGPHRRLALSARASGLSGSSLRRWPGLIATCQSTSNSKFSGRSCTPTLLCCCPAIPSPYLKSE